MAHVVLLGDSIFDNGAYTGGGPDVITQLRPLLPARWKATLLAVDGAMTNDVVRQVANLPRDSTNLVVSVGGNDALSHGDLLNRQGVSAAQVLDLLANAAAVFESRYRMLMELLERKRLPLTVCTVYNGNFPDPVFQRIASTALCVFNDAILRVAFERELSIIDLRLICRGSADYANAIEPSSTGGAKIARAVAQAVTAGRPTPAGAVIIATVTAPPNQSW